MALSVRKQDRRSYDRALTNLRPKGLRSPYSRVLGMDVQNARSGFAERAGEAVEDRLHDVLEKRTLSGLDVNVRGHPGRRDEFRHSSENIILVQAHPNDVEFATRVSVGTGFGLRLHLLR